MSLSPHLAKNNIPFSSYDFFEGNCPWNITCEFALESNNVIRRIIEVITKQ